MVSESVEKGIIDKETDDDKVEVVQREERLEEEGVLRENVGKAHVENDGRDDVDGPLDRLAFDEHIVKLVLAFFCDFLEKR